MSFEKVITSVPINKTARLVTGKGIHYKSEKKPLNKGDKVDNQHRKIKGYRELNETEILQMNNIKRVGETLNTMISSLERTEDIDRRWVSIAKTHLEEGIMAAVRAVAKPETF